MLATGQFLLPWSGEGCVGWGMVFGVVYLLRHIGLKRTLHTAPGGLPYPATNCATPSTCTHCTPLSCHADVHCDGCVTAVLLHCCKATCIEPSSGVWRTTLLPCALQPSWLDPAMGDHSPSAAGLPCEVYVPSPLSATCPQFHRLCSFAPTLLQLLLCAHTTRWWGEGG